MKKIVFYELVVIAISLLSITVNAQTENNSDEEVITVETKSVQTTLRATNATGKLQFVEKTDLRLFVDGKEQDVTYFASNKITKFIILLDASSSMRGWRYQRCIGFLNELAKNSLPDQNFDVIVFAEKTEFIGTFTKNDKKPVFEKLKNLRPYGETALYDSVVKTLNNIARQPESAALIILTDGENNASSEAKKVEADELLFQFGTLSYLIVLDTKMAFRNPGTASSDEIAENAVKDFQKILQPVAFVVDNETELNKLANRLPREAGFLVKIGCDLNEELLSYDEIHKLTIIHTDSKLRLNYRQSILMKKRGRK